MATPSYESAMPLQLSTHAGATEAARPRVELGSAQEASALSPSATGEPTPLSTKRRPKRAAARVRSWLRCAFAVVAGYAATAALVFGLLVASFRVLGEERAYAGSGYEVSNSWMALHLVLSLASATAGGYVCTLVDGRARALRALALWTGSAGLVAALAQPEASLPLARRAAVEGALTFFQTAIHPLWLVLDATAVGVCGVMLGGQLRRRQMAKRQTAEPMCPPEPPAESAASEDADAEPDAEPDADVEARDRGIFGSVPSGMAETLAKDGSANAS